MSKIAGEKELAVEAPTGGFRWIWVAIGVVVGAILVGTLVPVVRNEPPRPDVAILIGALTFVLTGILAGYHSPGKTVTEAGVAGAVLGGLVLVVLRILDFPVSGKMVIEGFIVGFFLAQLGGWVGEVLQGTIEADNARRGLQWPWIVVGTVVGVMLSCYAVFVLHALLEVSPLAILGAYLGSFLVAGAFVGYFSPGVTILEPALAAILIVAVDAILAMIGFRAPFPMAAIVLAMVTGFLLAMFGGFLGEVASNIRDGRAWGDVTRQAPSSVPEPGE